MRIVVAALTLLLSLPLKAANLTKDIDVFKTSMRIAEMWANERDFEKEFAQLLRKGYAREELLKHPDFGVPWAKATRDHTEEMKRIIAKWGWPTISLFGAEIDAKAYTLVEEGASDLAFQKRCLTLLAKALETRDTHPSHFASLWDRVHVNQHQPQRYGTQGQCVAKGLWEPSPIENRAQLNARRRAMGLEPFEPFASRQNTTCLTAPNQ